jgi:hypothetical protein
MMKPYQYQVIRYTHDRITGEFVNVGVVLYLPEDRFLKTLVTNRYARVSNFFPSASGLAIVQMLRQFRREVERVAQQYDELFPMPASLETITNGILPKDDSALSLTPLLRGVDVDPQIALDDLYYRLVEKYLMVDQTTSQTGEEAWRQAYKTYFDKYGITNRLVEHKVETHSDSFVFDKAWKNKVWHCYQPLSLNLADSNSVKSKVYRWSGILRELATAHEVIHLTFLLTRSEEFANESKFVYNKLTYQSESLWVNVVTEDEAETVARDVEQALKAHDKELDS